MRVTRRTDLGYACGYVYVPVVGTRAPHVSEAVDEEGLVQQHDVAYVDRVDGDVPGLVPAVDRDQGGDDEGQHDHDYFVVPVGGREYEKSLRFYTREVLTHDFRAR